MRSRSYPRCSPGKTALRALRGSILQTFTADPDLLDRKIRALKAGGGKAMYDALYSACQNVMLPPGDPEGVRRLRAAPTT